MVSAFKNSNTPSGGKPQQGAKREQAKRFSTNLRRRLSIFQARLEQRLNDWLEEDQVEGIAVAVTVTVRSLECRRSDSVEKTRTMAGRRMI